MRSLCNGVTRVASQFSSTNCILLGARMIELLRRFVKGVALLTAVLCRLGSPPSWYAKDIHQICAARPIYVAVIVLTSTHRHYAVRGHRTGSNTSGVEDYLRRGTNTTEDKTHNKKAVYYARLF